LLFGLVDKSYILKTGILRFIRSENQGTRLRA